jgi:hypothetical protein
MRRAAWSSALAMCALLSGCELVADFDRSKIEQDAGAGPRADGAVDAATTDDAATADEDATAPDEDSGRDDDAG